jgi:hypothetical protein
MTPKQAKNSSNQRRVAPPPNKTARLPKAPLSTRCCISRVRLAARANTTEIKKPQRRNRRNTIQCSRRTRPK